MGVTQEERKKMEGWLYVFRYNRLGLQYFRRRYFILRARSLDCYKIIPQSNKQGPLRSAKIDSCIRVSDNGREVMQKNTFFTFTLYNAYNHSEHLKLGARSPEEVTRWIQFLTDASLKDCTDKGENPVSCSGKRGQTSRPSHTRNRSRVHSVDWTLSFPTDTDQMASDVTAPSTWTIFSCVNGLRLFKEVKEGDFYEKNWYHPAIMAVAVVDATSEDIFRTLLSLGPSRSAWDFCMSQGSVVERLNDHTDIIHKKLHGDWLPRGMTRRDLLLERSWRREDNGTYVIGYHSVFHPNCTPDKGYIRADLKSGGYIISPVNHGKQSVVKHMLAIDWKSWRSYLFASSAEYVTIRMLARVAALREFFGAKPGDCSAYSSGELKREIGLLANGKEAIKVEVHPGCENAKSAGFVEQSRQFSHRLSKSEPSLQREATDEFFDVPDGYECRQSEAMRPSSEKIQSQDHYRASTAAVHAKQLQGRAVQKKVYEGLQEASTDDMAPYTYGTTLPKDTTCTMACSWSAPDPSTFVVRGETYLRDHHKVAASNTRMKIVAADWLKSNKREDDLGGRPGGIVQKYAVQDSSNFFFIMNFQVPGPINYNLALYYMMDTPLKNFPLLESFVKGDDEYRNSRLKIIPSVAKGSWIVKQSLGKKAVLLGQALKLNYFQGKNYLEVDVDVGSSKVAKSLSTLILSYLNNLVLELAFLIQANTQDELPEVLLGTCRLSHMDSSKSVSVDTL